MIGLIFRIQVFDLALERLREVDQLKVPHPPQSALDLGNRVAVDVPTNPLADRSQSGLRQACCYPQSPDLRPDYVFVLSAHCAGTST